MTEDTSGYGDHELRYRSSRNEPDLKHYVGVLRRRIWPLVTVFVIIVTLGTVYVFKTAPVYQAVARILIEKQTPRVMDFEDVGQLQSSDHEYYNTQRELVTSRVILEDALSSPSVREALERVHGQDSSSLLAEIMRTVSALLGSEPAAPPEPWEKLQQMLTVEQIRDTHLLAIKVESTYAGRAALLANAVARSFERYHIKRKLRTSSEAFDYLQQQKNEQEQNLLAAEQRLQEFREKAKVVSLDVADKSNPVLTRLSRLSDQLTEAQLKRIELEAQFSVVAQAVKEDGEGLEPNNEKLYSLSSVRVDRTVGELRARLVEAEKQVATLSDTYGREHPQLQAAQAEVDLLRARLKEALSQLVGSLTAELTMLRGQEEDLREQCDEQNLLALELAKQSLTFNRLQSDVERQRNLFDVLVERMKEVDLTADYAKTNVEVQQEAEVPRSPIRPKKARTVALSLFLGLFAGVGLAFLTEYLDDSVKTPEDLEERVGIPLLGFVPSMANGSASDDGHANHGLVCLNEPRGSATEAYRNIRTSLFFSAPVEESRVLVVTSGGPGDGKTTTATNLAIIIAQSEKQVLLIDADCRRPRVHQILGIENEVGLTSVLVGEMALEDAVTAFRLKEQDPVASFDVLPVGRQSPNPAELLGSENMRKLLAEAREKYDQVIVDTPPVLFVADATILSAMSDGVIMVVNSASNRRAARRARQQLEGVKARVLGGVLNNVRVSRLGYYYSDYYYHGYSRYYKDYYGSYYPEESEEEELES